MAYLYTPRDRQMGFGAGAPAGGTAVGTPSQPVSSGSYQNIMAFLGANKAGGERMGAELAGKLEADAKPLAGIPDRPGFSFSNAPTVYGDPTTKTNSDGSVETTTSWTKPAASVSDSERERARSVGDRLSAAKTSAGRQTLMGGNAFDAGLVDAWGKKPVEDVTARYGAIADMVRGYQSPGVWDRGQETTRTTPGKDNRTVAVPEAPRPVGVPGYGEAATNYGNPDDYPANGEWNGWGQSWL